MQVFENQALAFCWVPGAGIEPARIAPLLFETSASTDSAIRADSFRAEMIRIFWNLVAGAAEVCLESRRVDLLVRSAKVFDFSEIAK